MSDFDRKHLKAALHAAVTRVQEPRGDRGDAISAGMEECGVPDSDTFIVSELTAALVAFGNAIRQAERDEVPLLGIEIK